MPDGVLVDRQSTARPEMLVGQHLHMFCAFFALHRLSPHRSGSDGASARAEAPTSGSDVGRERMSLLFACYHLGRLRRTGNGALDGLLGGLVVVVLDLVVVLCFPVDEDAHADEQII